MTETPPLLIIPECEKIVKHLILKAAELRKIQTPEMWKAHIGSRHIAFPPKVAACSTWAQKGKILHKKRKWDSFGITSLPKS